MLLHLLSVSLHYYATGKYYIQLDGRTIKTPLKQDLFAPTRKLASVVATEWQTQQSVISPEKMHIVSQEGFVIYWMNVGWIRIVFNIL